MEAYQRNLHVTEPDRTFYDLSDGLAVSAKHLVPPELLSQSLQAKGLVIVPHGPLHLVPWPSLIFNRKRLFEYCPIGILPNLSCIQNLDTDFLRKPGVALVGSPDYRELPYLKPLAHAEREIETIKNLYSNQSRIIGTVLISGETTGERFRALANHKDAKGGILHIACHGTLELDEPMNSGLLLTDSKVDAAEIARSPLKYDEVVLSACSSGWRPMKVQGIELSGDDILGLPGAFLEAGVSSVLVSIPPAEDRAAYRFMTLYHQNRLKGKTPLIALQETQKTMLSDLQYEPYTWTGFVVYGCQ